MVKENTNNNVSLREFRRRAIRHGEVVLIPVKEIPAEATETFTGKEYIVAHSETGHHHVAVGSVGVLTLGETTFLKVYQDSVIEHRKTHEKHETKTLLKGLYTVTFKKAYDYFKKTLENVRD